MNYLIHHQTIYEYESTVSYSQHVARLRPSSLIDQFPESYELKVSPAPDSMTEALDYFGNGCNYFDLTTPHRKLTIDSYSKVSVTAPHRPSLNGSMAWEMVRDILKSSHLPEDLSASEFVHPSPMSPLMPELADYAQQSFKAGTPILEATRDLTARIHRDFEFNPKATTVSSSVPDIFKRRAGVCQDFSHLQISCLRSLGLAASYVSGYLRTVPPKGQKRLIGADASHAWVAVYSPQVGWTGFDATNDVIPGKDHIEIARGRDYLDISPVRGTVYGGGKQTLNIGVTVAEEDEELEEQAPAKS